MVTLDIQALRRQGAAVTAQNQPAVKRLVLIYGGVLALLTLGVNGLYMLLDRYIGGTGGLDGMGLRSVLQTVQQILTYVNIIFGPFWAAGFLGAMMAMVRGRAPRNTDLLTGFHRFGRVLGYLSFQFLMTMALMLVVMYLSAILFALSPMGLKLAEVLAPMLDDPNLFTASGAINLELLPAETLMDAMIPMMVLMLALFLPLYAWLSYHFRLALYLVMDDAASGIQAHFQSLRLMRGHKWQMLKLDLSFWWYYALTGLTVAVGYLDMILETLGITVSIDSTVLYFLTMGACCLLQMALFLWKKCPVDAAYVLAYDAITAPQSAPAETK